MKRNYGIDLLRMILMFMIVVLHVLRQGGILDAVSITSANYYIGWVMECLCFCAVNCYALITGYVYHGSKYKVSSLLSIWLQALVYSIGISVIFWADSPDLISFGGLLNAFFPVSRKVYWYVSAYAGLFILIPLLNRAIDSLSLWQAKCFLCAGFVFFTVLSTFLLEDPFGLNRGYSTIWLIFLYLVGAFIRKFKWESVLSRKLCFVLFLVCGIFSALFKFAAEHIPLLHSFDTNIANILISYVSPTTFFAAVALFLAFLQLDLHPGACKLIGKYAPAAFGVYLIHCQPYIFDSIENLFAFLAGYNPMIMVTGVIAIALGIYIFCLFIDYLRILLFRKLHVNEILGNVTRRFTPEDVSA